MKLLKVKNSVLKEGVHYLTSDYKTRNSSRGHNGMDMIGKNKRTDYVVAIASGVVITATYSKTAGYYVEIRHNNGYISRYLHMKKGSLMVKKGDTVQKGQVLGFMGNTGNSSGAHLHFAVYSKKRTPLDPLPYLTGEKDLENVSVNYYKEFVMQVQEALGAKVDGIAGPETLVKTITVSAKTNRNHPVVKPIQTYLYNIGYTEVGNADGIAGPKFTKAIKQFQKDNNCVVDGVITKRNKTWKKLLKL